MATVSDIREYARFIFTKEYKTGPSHFMPPPSTSECELIINEYRQSSAYQAGFVRHSLVGKRNIRRMLASGYTEAQAWVNYWIAYERRPGATNAFKRFCQLQGVVQTVDAFGQETTPHYLAELNDQRGFGGKFEYLTQVDRTWRTVWTGGPTESDIELFTSAKDKLDKTASAMRAELLVWLMRDNDTRTTDLSERMLEMVWENMETSIAHFTRRVVSTPGPNPFDPESKGVAWKGTTWMDLDVSKREEHDFAEVLKLAKYTDRAEQMDEDWPFAGFLDRRKTRMLPDFTFVKILPDLVPDKALSPDELKDVAVWAARLREFAEDSAEFRSERLRVFGDHPPSDAKMETSGKVRPATLSATTVTALEVFVTSTLAKTPYTMNDPRVKDGWATLRASIRSTSIPALIERAMHDIKTKGAASQPLTKLLMQRMHIVKSMFVKLKGEIIKHKGRPEHSKQDAEEARLMLAEIARESSEREVHLAGKSS